MSRSVNCWASSAAALPESVRPSRVVTVTSWWRTVSVLPLAMDHSPEMARLGPGVLGEDGLRGVVAIDGERVRGGVWAQREVGRVGEGPRV